MPHRLLALFAWGLTIPTILYIQACRIVPLPMHRFMTQVLGKFSWSKIHLDIYDQCNPAYAKYYTRQEAYELLAGAGFSEVRMNHRHGYSWTVVGTKPQ